MGTRDGLLSTRPSTGGRFLPQKPECRHQSPALSLVATAGPKGSRRWGGVQGGGRSEPCGWGNGGAGSSALWGPVPAPSLSRLPGDLSHPPADTERSIGTNSNILLTQANQILPPFSQMALSCYLEERITAASGPRLSWNVVTAVMGPVVSGERCCFDSISKGLFVLERASGIAQAPCSV